MPTSLALYDVEFSERLRTLPRSKLCTGMLYVREASGPEPPPDDSGRKLFMVMGVIAVPQDCQWKENTQIPVVSVDGGETLRLHINDSVEADGTTHHLNADQTILRLKWKI